MRTFLDTSALAKRYISERGSEAVARHCADATEIIVSIICVAELLSAFNRIRRDGALTPAQYEKLKRDMSADLGEALVVDVSEPVVPATVRCLEASPLRGLDAIHLGTAIACSVDLFVTADNQQARAARAQGLEVARLR